MKPCASWVMERYNRLDNIPENKFLKRNLENSDYLPVTLDDGRTVFVSRMEKDPKQALFGYVANL